MKINWKIRFKNPIFIGQLILSILMPIVGYAGITLTDLTSWAILGNVLLGAIGNPYVIGLVAVALYNALTDPTTRGVSDSIRAQTYDDLH